MSISRVLRRGAGLIAAAGLLVGLVVAPAGQAVAGPAQATVRPSGHLYQGLGYVPKSVKRGHSFVVSLWFMQRSPDNVQVMATGLLVLKGDGSSAGVRVDWLDPVTKRWEPTTGNWGTTESHYLQLPVAPRLVYRSGVWGHVYARITFTSRAHLGKWAVMPNALYEYQLWTKSGQPVAGFLDQPTSTTGADVYVRS